MDGLQAIGIFFGGAIFGAGLVIAALRAANTPPEQMDRRRPERNGGADYETPNPKLPQGGSGTAPPQNRVKTMWD
jgi:hypothetical protein